MEPAVMKTFFPRLVYGLALVLFLVGCNPAPAQYAWASDETIKQVQESTPVPRPTQKYSPNSGGSSSSSQNKGDITIPAGKLRDYVNSYSSYNNVYVKKANGTTDSRANDLEELCKDWLYYRRKITEAESAGDSDRANDYRNSFNSINNWLNDYKESDVTAMFDILDK